MGDNNAKLFPTIRVLDEEFDGLNSSSVSNENHSDNNVDRITTGSTINVRWCSRNSWLKPDNITEEGTDDLSGTDSGGITGGDISPESRRKFSMGENGVIRRSIRRRLSREAETARPRYGESTEEYKKIVKRITEEKNANNTIGALKERINMMKLMVGDCNALIQKKRKIQRKRRRKEKFERFLPCIYAALGVFAGVVAVVATWFLLKIKPEGAVSM